MKYFIRAVKYYVYLMIILSLIILIMVKAGFVEADITKIFVNGTDSLWQIAGIMAVFAALYPRMGYVRRKLHLMAEPGEAKGLIRKAMEDRSYRIAKETDDSMIFVKRAPFARAMRMWEDGITITQAIGGWEIEGPGRDIVRVASALEAINRTLEEDV